MFSLPAIALPGRAMNRHPGKDINRRGKGGDGGGEQRVEGMEDRVERSANGPLVVKIK